MASVRDDIILNIKYEIDSASQNKVKESLQQLAQIQKLTVEEFKKMTAPTDNSDRLAKYQIQLLKIQKTAGEVQKALTTAFNSKLGTFNIDAFKNSINSIGADRIVKDFSALGATGKNAFRTMTTELLSTHNQLKKTSTLVEKMGTTIANTIRWSISTTLLNGLTGSIQHAYNFTEQLNTSLNNIRIVTGKSADEMERFAEKANKAAQQLATSTKAYTDASLIFYQQGRHNRH